MNRKNRNPQVLPVDLSHFASAEGLCESGEPFKQIGKPAHEGFLVLVLEENKGEFGESWSSRRGVRSQNPGVRMDGTIMRPAE